MHRLKKPDIYASEVAGLLNLELIGKDVIINTPSTIDGFGPKSFICITKKEELDNIGKADDLLIITNLEFAAEDFQFSFIKSDNPRIDFINSVREFFILNDEIKIAASAKIHTEAQIGRNVTIGENVVIGPDVEIGENTIIGNNVVITNQVKIGADCIINHNTTIGSEGFDFEIDKIGEPILYPHIGKIIIGDKVWIGSNSSIECGKVESTIIGDNVKIDDLVQIGYNCKISKNVMITAGVIVERDVTICENTTLAPNSTIRTNIKIGKNCIVGDGAVVTKNIEDNSVCVGNPARFLKSNL